MKIRVSDLIFDKSLYPRKQLISMNVAEYAEAMRAGDQFPAIAVQKGTNRIVDGVHRWKAYRQVFGDDYEIECELFDEDDEGKLLARAVELNTAHGEGLASFERTDCLLRLQKLGVTKDVCYQVLRITADKAEKIQASTAWRVDEGGKKEQIALKSSMKVFRGETLNEKQQEANNRSGGMKMEYYANQILDLVDAGFCARANDSQVALLHRPKDALLENLPPMKSKAEILKAKSDAFVEKMKGKKKKSA
ncbi:MAG: hypothetical protein WBQ07_19120 [Candidatus Acidiferrales bacterium]